MVSRTPVSPEEVRVQVRGSLHGEKSSGNCRRHRRGRISHHPTVISRDIARIGVVQDHGLVRPHRLSRQKHGDHGPSAAGLACPASQVFRKTLGVEPLDAPDDPHVQDPGLSR